ncbi:hypothetical protein GN958_ATG02159, partial [Phytophthora infestans]
NNSEDRLRIIRVNQAFLNGKRSTDADFSVRLEEAAVNKKRKTDGGEAAKQKKKRMAIAHYTVAVSGTDSYLSRTSEVTGAAAALLVVLDAAATTTDEPCTHIQHDADVVCSDIMEIDGLDSDCTEDADELVFVDEEDAVAHDPQNNVSFPNADRPSIEPAAVSESSDEVSVDDTGV